MDNKDLIIKALKKDIQKLKIDNAHLANSLNIQTKLYDKSQELYTKSRKISKYNIIFSWAIILLWMILYSLATKEYIAILLALSSFLVVVFIGIIVIKIRNKSKNVLQK